MTRWTRLGLAVFILGVWTSEAQGRNDGAPASSVGMSGGAAASAVGSSALFYNPAGMSQIRQYVVEGGYSLSSELDGQALSVTAVDSRTNGGLALGMGYTKIYSEPDGIERNGNGIRGAIATGFRDQSFSFLVGLGGNYLKLVRGEVDTDETLSPDDLDFFTVDAGVLLAIGSVLRLAAVGRNLVATDAPSEAPKEIGLGVAVSFGTMELTFDSDLDLDAMADETVVTYRVGGQLLLGGSIVARAGLSIDGHDESKRLGLGLGYVSPLMAADLAFRKLVDQRGGTMVALAVRYFLP